MKQINSVILSAILLFCAACGEKQTEMSATSIPMDDFMKLTHLPILIYYGDYIATEPSDN